MIRILLVEDSDLIIKGLTFALTQAQYEVSVCKTARQVEDLTGQVLFDLAILDVMLPDGSGFSICKRLKEDFPEMPVIFLTAKDAESDVVLGFDCGADDYVIKPFRNRELLSRIQNALRRYHKGAAILTSGDVRLDLDADRIYRGEKEVQLTALEFKVVTFLFQNQGRTISRETLLSRIWDFTGNFVNDNTLTVTIKRIREKLGEGVIQTIKGLGYRVD